MSNERGNAQCPTINVQGTRKERTCSTGAGFVSLGSSVLGVFFPSYYTFLYYFLWVYNGN